MIATQDSASNTWQPAADALRRLGVTDPILLEFRGSFAFIGYAGGNKPSWIAQEQQKRYEGPSIIHLRIPLQQSAPGDLTFTCFIKCCSCLTKLIMASYLLSLEPG